MTWRETDASWTPLDTASVAPLRYVDDVMTCPIVGWTIPKKRDRNIVWRATVIGECEKSPEFMATTVAACMKSVLLAVNLFFWVRSEWTYDEKGQKHSAEEAMQPAITWPCQDRELLRLDRCVREGKPWVGRKSREMGWTWLQVWYDCWRCLFSPKYSVVCASEKEDRVDDSVDPHTIFAKYRACLRVYDKSEPGLPAFLLPDGIQSSFAGIKVLHTGSTIIGEATTPDVARSARPQRAWIDEAAKVDVLEAVDASLSYSAKSYGYLSTPWAGTHFNKLCLSPNFEQATMYWYEHPEKGLGRRPVGGDYTPFRSPWFDAEERVRTKATMLSEVCASLEGAGLLVFDPSMLAGLRSRCEMPMEGSIRFSPSMAPNELALADDRLAARDVALPKWDAASYPRRWSIWCDLVPDGRAMRPDQDDLYAIGADVGQGLGRANSTISVARRSDNRKVAEWAWPDYQPHDFARIVVAAAIWFGGKRPPIIVFERNGPGEEFAVHLWDRLAWPNIWTAEAISDLAAHPGTKLGWFSTEASKVDMIGQYAAALSSGEFVNPSARSLDEAAGFIYGKSGRITQGSRADMTSGASAAHGDMVIADGLAWLGLQRLPPVVKRDYAYERAVRNPRTPLGMKAATEARKRLEAAAAADWKNV